MGFRTLEISQAAELHIKNGQLEITSAEGVALIRSVYQGTFLHLECAIIEIYSIDFRHMPICDTTSNLVSIGIILRQSIAHLCPTLTHHNLPYSPLLVLFLGNHSIVKRL